MAFEVGLIVVAALAKAFIDESFFEVVRNMLVKLPKREPILESKNNTPVLAPPSHRLSLGKKLLNGEEALAIYLEKAEGPAYAQALALQKQEPTRVVIEVVGFAQSAFPEDNEAIETPFVAKFGPGSSVGHIHGRAGSLGAFVNFQYTPRGPYYKGFTSAAHVLGCHDSIQKGDPVVSPGRPDVTPDITHRVGKLGRCKYLTHYSEQNDPQAIINQSDIGVVELDDDTACPAKNLVSDPKDPKDLMQITGVLDQDSLIAHLDQPVYMVGRTSGFAEGYLDAVSVAAFPIKLPNGKKYLYGDLNVVKPKSDSQMFSRPGDSGAMVYTADGKMVGFLVGGSPKCSFFHPAFQCLKYIDAKLI